MFVAVILAVGAGVLFRSVKSNEKELRRLQQENEELPGLRAALEQDNKKPAVSDVARVEKEREELIRLRNEVGVLRREKQQLATQFQQAQKSQERLENKQTEQTQLLQQLARVNHDQQRDTCITNLRQIDGAKQQWALEYKQAEEALPVAQQIEPYLPGAKLPGCPSGGIYKLGKVKDAPCILSSV